jgi:hypothetical protein
MPLTFVISSSDLEFVNRLDAELYRPHLKESYNHLIGSRIPLSRLRKLCLIRSGTTPTDRDDDLKEAHPTNAYFVSWRPRIFSLKNA